MIGKHFRPWGEFSWVLSKLPNIKWDLVSCLSAEDRFIGTALELVEKELINRSLFFEIVDPPSRDTQKIASKVQDNKARLEQLITQNLVIEEHTLLEPYKNIVNSINSFLSKGNENIILDISTFPKRFFFPIMKLLMNKGLKNLVVTYSTPESYCNGDLSSNPHSWDHLPLFMPVDFPEPEADVAIIGIGFMPFSLPDLLLTKYNATPVKFLFPFPPGPPNYQRTWEFVRKIENSFTFKPSDNIIRIDSNNMPDAFEYIANETDNGSKRVIFAPYGPKPISLAMCIYATLKDSSAYYTQPTHYNPDYSTGIKSTYAYCIILDGKNLYSV